MSHIWMSHVTYTFECGRVTRMNKSCPACHTYEWVMSHIWLSHVTYIRMNAGVSHVWTRLVPRMNESCRRWKDQECTLRMSQVTHMDESCHTYERVVLHVWMSHVTKYERVISHARRSRAHSSISQSHFSEKLRVLFQWVYFTWEWVISHVWTSHVEGEKIKGALFDTEESCHRNSKGTLRICLFHVGMSHVTRMNESCCRPNDQGRTLRYRWYSVWLCEHSPYILWGGYD